MGLCLFIATWLSLAETIFEEGIAFTVALKGLSEDISQSNQLISVTTGHDGPAR